MCPLMCPNSYGAVVWQQSGVEDNRFNSKRYRKKSITIICYILNIKNVEKWPKLHAMNSAALGLTRKMIFGAYWLIDKKIGYTLDDTEIANDDP